MNSSARVLILYATAGAGHRRAAEALAGALLERNATVALLDAIRFTHPLFRAIYVGGGLRLITRLPWLYNVAYQISDVAAVDRVLRRPRHHAQRISTPHLFQTIETFQPDTIVCTHFLPAELCAGWRRSGRLNVPLYVAITDFEPHFMWQHAGVDGYYVPTDAARDRLVQDGSDPSIVKVTGIPIQPQFTQPPERAAAARRLRLDPARPILLIMGGGLGVGAIEEVARSLLARPIPAQVVFITGGNHGLRRRLKAMSPAWTVRGFVGNMLDWLAAADVAISKAGGLAASELLAAGVPAIIPRSLTGHETLNATYLASTGAAVLTGSAAAAVEQAASLLNDAAARAQMRAAGLRAARPAAATEVSELVLRTASAAPRTAVWIPQYAAGHAQYVNG